MSSAVWGSGPRASLLHSSSARLSPLPHQHWISLLAASVFSHSIHSTNLYQMLFYKD